MNFLYRLYIRLNRYGKTIRRFEEGLRSMLYYAFGKIILESKLKVKRKKAIKNKNSLENQR